MCHSNVDARNAVLSTSYAPADDAHQLPGPRAFAHQRSATVPFARVFSFFSTGTNKSWMQLEVVTESRLPHLLLTLRLSHDGHVHFLQDVLVLSEFSKRVFAPAGCPTARSSEVLSGIGKTRRTDMRMFGPVHRFVHS